jgi:hypothetical protein
MRNSEAVSACPHLRLLTNCYSPSWGAVNVRYAKRMVRSKVQSSSMQQAELLALAMALGARTVSGWTTQEQALVRELPAMLPLHLAYARETIARGEDPLGEAFCRLFSAEERRPMGATYTPVPIVEAMLQWAEANVAPDRVVDPGAGSGRFLVAAGHRFPRAELVASELDPVAAVMARGHLAAAGCADRAKVVVGDYRQLELPTIKGRTLFLGNPPYVRHHLIDPIWKDWLVRTAKRYGHRASQLAGLHVHFFLATAELARPGDVGVFITAAEWLDVNYGRLVRELLLGTLGATDIHVIEPTAEPFPGTQSTAVITGFEVGAQPARIGLRRVSSLSALDRLQTDWSVGRDRLQAADRWTPLTRPTAERREGFVELGELCRVHRGQVTGANNVWITQENLFDLPDSVLFAAVTKARELFAVDGILSDTSRLKHVIDLPSDLDGLDELTLRSVRRFLAFARSKGADSGYIARNRKAWWSVGLRQPAPILASYMARRPPTFVRNLANARHINIAHGLYPREHLSDQQLQSLATYLSRSVTLSDGRTYAGGLTKFEPSEMERLLVPRPQLLADAAYLEALV